MAEERKYLHIPGHVPIKEAALLLGVSDDSIQLYIKQKRLAAEKVDGRYMIPEQAIRDFQNNPPGRRRTKPTPWRMYSVGARVHALQIEIQVVPGKHTALQQKLLSISQEQQHLFSGTMQRYVFENQDNPDAIIIQLIWKNTELADETTFQHDLETFQSEFADLLDWQTARYTKEQAIIHT